MVVPSGFTWMDGDKLARGVYFNNGALGIAIVAVEGQASDWAAYIGASAQGAEDEIAAFVYAKRHGVKLPTELAARIFPDITNWRR